MKGMIYIAFKSKAANNSDSISKCKVIADIGSDHAKLPIYLVKNKKQKQ